MNLVYMSVISLLNLFDYSLIFLINNFLKFLFQMYKIIRDVVFSISHLQFCLF